MTEAEIDHALAKLEKLAVDTSGWLSLYRDPATGALWEVSYPQSEMHGGGPRRLALISMDAAKVRYPAAPISN